MSRNVDLGIAERWVWLKREQTPVMPVRIYPFTFPEVLSYVLLGFLVAAVLVVWIGQY